MEKKWILEEKGYFYFPVYFIIVLMLLDGIDINLGGSWLVWLLGLYREIR